MISTTNERFLLVLVAGCCIFAAGTAASTLDASMQTDPEEAVDLDYRYLPVGEDDVIEVKNQAESGAKTEKRTSAEQGEPGRDRQSAAASRSSSSDGASSDGSGSFAGERTSDGGDLGGGLGFAPGTVWWLIDLLLPLLLLLVAVLLAYRYRDRLLALALAVAGWIADRTDAGPDADRSPWPGGEPANAVHRAWLAMVRRAAVDRPESRTPAECAREAVAAGLDPEAVRTLTRLFEEVRYGGAPVTDERERAVREQLHRLDAGGGA